MIMYRLSFNEIEAYEVIKITASSIVFINDRGKETMERKYAGYQSWYNTKQEAFDAAVIQLKNKIHGCYERISEYERQKDRLAKSYPEFIIK